MVCCNMLLMSIVQPLDAAGASEILPFKGCISLRYAPKHFSALWTLATAVRTVPGTAALKINNHMVKVPGSETVWSVGTELGSHPPKNTHTHIMPSKIARNISALIRQPVWSQDSKPHRLCLVWCFKVDYHWDAKLQGRVLAMHQVLEIWHSLDLEWQITTGRFTVHRMMHLWTLPQTGISLYVHCIMCYFEDCPISQSGSSSKPSHSFGMLHANGTQDV